MTTRRIPEGGAVHDEQEIEAVVEVLRTTTLDLGERVAEFERQVADLQSRGVQFERFGFFEQDALGIWTAPGGDKVAWFKDPDGNVLSVSQHV